MLHVMSLFTVPNHEDAFIRSLRMNGEWHTLARRIAPNLVATDLLRHQLSPLYICHDFWTTPEAYFRGLHSQAVRDLYHRQANCLLSPTHHPLVRETFKAIRREIGTRQSMKQALMTAEVPKIVACCPDTLAGKRDKALYLVSFAGMLRREDSAGLRVEGLRFTPEGLVMVLDHGKTDQESRGREIAIVPGVNATTCPIQALRDYLDAAKISSGPVFRGIDQKGRVSHSSLHRDSIGYILKRAAARAGMNVAGIAGHSLRSGGITTAATNGVPEYIIRRQSHHAPESRSFHRYIRLAERFTKNASSGLGL